MKIVVEHKLDDEQKEEMKSEFGDVREELEEALKELRFQVESTFDGWEKTKKIFTYTLVATGVGGFAFGFIVGKLWDS